MHVSSLKQIERELVIVASVGIRDELKESNHSVIEKLYDAGINTRIITGDHKDSAIKLLNSTEFAKFTSEHNSGLEL